MIEIDQLTKVYDGEVAVDNVSMTVETGTITVIVGTSGSGKTTLLRMINRLEEPTSGTVRMNGDLTNSMPKHSCGGGSVMPSKGMVCFRIIRLRATSELFQRCLGGRLIKYAPALMSF